MLLKHIIILESKFLKTRSKRFNLSCLFRHQSSHCPPVFCSLMQQPSRAHPGAHPEQLELIHTPSLIPLNNSCKLDHPISIYVHSYALPVLTPTNPCSAPDTFPLFLIHINTAPFLFSLESSVVCVPTSVSVHLLSLDSLSSFFLFKSLLK